MNRALIAGNWKMNPVTAAEAAALSRALIEPARTHAGLVQTVVCPPFPWLLGVAEVLDGSTVELGAQDCYWEASGAFTGEVSAAMLEGWCSWVITGHSERRTRFGETDADVARKLRAALDVGLKVIACVGESQEQHDAGRADEVVRGQAQAALEGLALEAGERLVLAYEPVWAIGTGRNADPEHAYRTMRAIRGEVTGCLGPAMARDVRCIYGGSVNAGNVGAYVELPNCDGCLVGGASLKAAEFEAMLAAVAEVYERAGRPAP
ncbi:MAG: triose-phosphate isomerase [Candidatus Dormibacteraeota bacterium]|nr:triose-phosphate isomerase [Candidatus Dormibacteraeota bacterium]